MDNWPIAGVVGRLTMRLRAVLAVASVLVAVGACAGTQPPPAPSPPSAASPSAPPPASVPSAPIPPAAPGPAADVSPAGDIPDDQAFVPVTSPDSLFTVSVPEGWARSQQGPATVFVGRLNSVRIEEAASTQAPTVESVGSGELPSLTATTPGFRPGRVSSVTRAAGPAVLVTYQADSTPDPVTGKRTVDDVERYEFWHAGQQVTVTLAAPVGADNVDPWRTVTDSLRWNR